MIIPFPTRPPRPDQSHRTRIAKTLEAADEAALAGNLALRDALLEAARLELVIEWEMAS